jgi:6-pyruvoyltetrahydropterin/6-carboxytetrahydropterin synthase
MAKYTSEKTFDNFSVALRQWKAKHSMCQLLHGYALEFTVTFASNEPEIDKQLDDMNWVVDYGSFKKPPQGNGLRAWLDDMFDHTTLIEKDDPYLDYFQSGAMEGVMKLIVMDKMGAESIAKLVFDKFNERLSQIDAGRCRVVKVICRENKTNLSTYEE